MDYEMISQYEIRFTLHEIRKSSTIVECIRQISFFMQNEPNFPDTQMNVTSYNTRNYEQRTMNYEHKNEPKTNPNEPNL